MIERKFHMSVSNCIFHGPGFPARMIEIYPKGWGLFLYLWRHEGGRMVLMPVCPFSLLFLLITIRDGHAEREESNYRVGEDISWGREKKSYLQGLSMGCTGWRYVFIHAPIPFCAICLSYVTHLSAPEWKLHSIWLVNTFAVISSF